MYVLALLLVAGSLYMVSTQNTDYVIIPPAMSMDDVNKYVSFTVFGLCYLLYAVRKLRLLTKTSHQLIKLCISFHS